MKWEKFEKIFFLKWLQQFSLYLGDTCLRVHLIAKVYLHGTIVSKTTAIIWKTTLTQITHNLTLNDHLSTFFLNMKTFFYTTHKYIRNKAPFHTRNLYQNFQNLWLNLDQLHKSWNSTHAQGRLAFDFFLPKIP